MIEMDADRKHILIPKNSPLYFFIMNLATDLTIGSSDHFAGTDYILRRPRRTTVPGRSPSMIAVKVGKVDAAGDVNFKIEVDGDSDIYGSTYTGVIKDLTLSDMEILFEGVGKAILDYKYHAQTR